MRLKLLIKYIFTLSAFLFISTGVVPDSYAWLSGWDKRIKLTTDHTVVDATLSNFPVYVNLSTSSGKSSTDVSAVFDEVGANWQKMAIANSSDTECYVEKVSWNATNENAELWAKFVSVSNTADENWYLYYDNDHADNTVYAKAVGEATSVWDSNFVLVLHMSEDPSGSAPQMVDSTSNSNDGTSSGNMASDDLVTAQIGKGLNFDGSDDLITIPDAVSLDVGTSDFSIKIWAKTSDTQGFLVCKDGVDPRYYVAVLSDTGSKIRALADDSSNVAYGDGDTTVNDSTLHQVVCDFDRSETDMSIYVDGVAESVTMTGALSSVGNLDNGNTLRIAYGDSFLGYLSGILDEIRISNVVRSADWKKASRYSEDDNLITFGSEETQAGPATPFGLGVDTFEMIQ